MKALRIADNLTLPLDALTQTLVVYGGKGQGKTNLAAVMAEELYRNNLKFSVLDPLGVNWGLQHGRSGDQAGLKIVVMGGFHGDIQIEPSAGAVVADFVADEAVSTVVDISRRADGKMWSFGDRIRFVADYANRLFERQGERRVPLMQIIDEAGRFCPQTIPAGARDLAFCVGAIEQLVEWGRNVGIGVMLITQRSARMNKSVSELAECMIAFRTIGPNSVEAVMDWMGQHVEKERLKGLIQQVRTLKRGSALVVSPGWLEFEGVAHIRLRETFDSSKTPEVGVEPKAPGRASKPDLDHYRVRMAETERRAKAEDPRELKKQIAELQRKLQTGRSSVSEESVRIARSEGYFEGVISGRKEWQALERKIVDEIRGLRDRLGKIRRLAGEAGEDAPAVKESLRVVRQTPRRIHGEIEAPKPRLESNPKHEQHAQQGAKLKAGAREILNGLAVRHPAPMTRAQVAMLCGIKTTGSTMSSYMSNLRTAGLIAEQGDRVTLSPDGLAYFNGDMPEKIRSTGEMIALWSRRLKRGARQILDKLVRCYPDGMVRQELAEMLDGINPEGSTLSSYLSNLRTCGLINESGGLVYAHENLFNLETS